MAQSSSNTVEVIFGAQIAGLLSGVKEVEHAIKSLKQPVDDFVKSFKEIGELVGIAYAIEKVGELAKEMAELGEHATNMGLALGMSAEQFQTVSESMQLVGASADALVRVERQLSRAAEQATSQSISHQADAFRALRIDAAQFAETLRTDPIAAFKELADAVQRTGLGGVAGPLGFLLGRGGGADLYRYFSQGAKGIDELIAKSKELGAPTGETLKQLDELAEKMNAMNVGFKNLGIAIISGFNEPLAAAVDLLTQFTALTTKHIEEMSKATRGGPAGTYGGNIYTGPQAHHKGQVSDWLGAHGYSSEASAAIMGNAQVESSFDPSARDKTGHFGLFQWDTERQKPLGGSTDVVKQMELMDTELQKLDPSFRTATGSVKELTDRFDKIFERSAGTSRGAREAAAEGQLPDVEVEAKASKARMENSIAEKKALDEQIKSLNEATKARLAWLSLEEQAAKGAGDNEAALKIAKQKIDVEREAEEQIKALKENASKAVGDTVQGSADKEINLMTRALALEQSYHAEQVRGANEVLQAKIKALNAEEAEDLKQVDRQRQLNQLTIAESAAKERQIVEAHQKAADQILAEEQKNATGLTKISQRIAAERISLENQTAQKIKDINDKADDDRLKSAQQINQTIARDFSSQFISLITGRETFTQAFAQLGEKLGQTLVEKIMEQLLTKLGVGALFSGGGGIGSILGGLPLIGGLFGGGAGGVIADSVFMERGGIIPSAAGGWQVPGNMLAMLHQNEMVLPSHISQGFQDMFSGRGGGGGSTVNLAVHAWDTMTGGQQLMRNAQSVGQALTASGLSPRALSAGGGRFP